MQRSKILPPTVVPFISKRSPGGVFRRGADGREVADVSLLRLLRQEFVGDKAVAVVVVGRPYVSGVEFNRGAGVVCHYIPPHVC